MLCKVVHRPPFAYLKRKNLKLLDDIPNWNIVFSQKRLKSKKILDFVFFCLHLG